MKRTAAERLPGTPPSIGLHVRFLRGRRGRLPERKAQTQAQVIRISEGQALCGLQAASPSLSLPAERIANVDRLRVLAAIGIVWFHTEGTPYRQIAYAGLPIFLLIFYSLLTGRGSDGTTMDFLRRRCDRLLKPWLFWSCVYGLCRLIKAVPTMDIDAMSKLLRAETLLAGTSIHLWYLPYAFASGLLIYGLHRWTARVNHAVVVLAATIAGAVILAGHATALFGDRLPRPLPQWEFGLAAIPLGFAVGRCLAIPSCALRTWLLLAICLITVIEWQVLSLLGFGNRAIPYGVAVVAMCLAYCRDISGGIIAARLASLTFGIYLIHPLVAYAVRHSPVQTGPGVLSALLTLCISALIVLILRRTPIRRFV